MRKLKNEELGRVDADTYKSIAKKPFCIMLDNVRSMNNVGSAFRTADAFLAEQIILTGITAQPPHREIHKTALGATESVDWVYYATTAEAVKALKEDGWVIVAIEQADKSMALDAFTPDPEKKYCFVFGNEVFGVDDAIIPQVDSVIEIPQFGTKHSLNISVTIGIVSWHFIINSQ